ncbi:ArsR/SmtB family transcription factor [Fontivita pretiosa]|uniref:ArsR/SmtB family transcription factor n=1 Tax=Fontivita pretiosa TaxID=2989684 RepID=UPI003D168E8D
MQIHCSQYLESESGEAQQTSAPAHHEHGPLTEAQLQAVAQLFHVLSEPTRLRIVQLLQRGPASVGQIVSQLGQKQANVSKQLSILLQAGIVRRQQQGNRAIYAIAMPLVLDLCHLVCAHVANQARQQAARLAASAPHAESSQTHTTDEHR